MLTATLLAIGLVGVALVSNVQAGKVGVTAAVNPNAKGKRANGVVRTLYVGNNIHFRERIKTSGTGLVQVLFADGSTITVGAGADLVIDKFVYNPKKGTGQLAVRFSKGALRFIGGRLSKQKGGVQIRTSVGTAGIRGAIANILVASNRARFSLMFGHEIVFHGRGGANNRIYQSGFTLDVFGNGIRTQVRRTTLADVQLFERLAAGRRGRTGGARRVPSNRRVANSPFPHTNSNNPVGILPPGQLPRTVLSAPLRDREKGFFDLQLGRDAINDFTY